jgi:hypothetical protein
MRGAILGNRVRECGLGVRSYHFSGMMANNVITECDEGWYLDAQAWADYYQRPDDPQGEASVTGNIIQNCRCYGVRLEEFAGAFVGNHVLGNGSDDCELLSDYDIPPGGAGLVISDAFTCTISGNAISSNRTLGVFINNNSSGVNPPAPPARDVLLQGNTIANNGSDGIRLNGKLEGVIAISDNQIVGNGQLPDSSPLKGTDTYAGVRANTDDSSGATLWIHGNIFAKGTVHSGDGTKFGITSLEPDEDLFGPVERLPQLVQSGNLFIDLVDDVRW